MAVLISKQIQFQAPIYKCILIGDLGVGKSSLMFRVLRNKTLMSTTGVLSNQRFIEEFYSNGKNIKLQICDTGRFGHLSSSYRFALGIMLVYDITNRDSFDALVKWMEEAKKKCHHEASFMLIGSKFDMENEREISYEEGERFARENKMIFLETSASLTGKNAREAFAKMAEMIDKKAEIGLFDDENCEKLETVIEEKKINNDKNFNYWKLGLFIFLIISFLPQIFRLFGLKIKE